MIEIFGGGLGGSGGLVFGALEIHFGGLIIGLFFMIRINPCQQIRFCIHK